MPVGFKAFKYQPYDVDAFDKPLDRAIKKIGGSMLSDYELTFQTWDHKPVFTMVFERRLGARRVTVGTDDEIYGYVERGTPPHTIRPRRAKYLRFREAYGRKTRVGNLRSYRGGGVGRFVYRQRVRHPGTKPRDFTKLVVKNAKRIAAKEIQGTITATIDGMH